MHLFLFIFLLLSNTTTAHAITLEKTLENPVQENRAKALFHEIRCMVCSGESIADSRAKLALDLRYFIRKHIKEGKKDEDIIALLQTSYGDEILMRPPLQENTLALWLTPFLLLVIGGFTLRRLVKH